MGFNLDEPCADGDSGTDLVYRRPWPNGNYRYRSEWGILHSVGGCDTLVLEVQKNPNV
jgi:hypothetical protein